MSKKDKKQKKAECETSYELSWKTKVAMQIQHKKVAKTRMYGGAYVGGE